MDRAKDQQTMEANRLVLQGKKCRKTLRRGMTSITESGLLSVAHPTQDSTIAHD
jgi:hypothetical protein